MKEEKDSNRVGICLITDKDDDILMGKRNDNSLWTMPGGHLKKGECPYAGTVRELKEETGLDATEIQLVGCKKAGKLMLYLFKIEVDSEQLCDTSEDPDNECNDWNYTDPNEVKEELHVPLEKNMALNYWATH